MPYNSNLKIKPEHYKKILDSFVALGDDVIKSHKAFLQTPACRNKPKDLDKRLRWDCLHATLGSSHWISAELYPYLNDDHIDSALKQVMIDMEIAV